MDCTEIALFFWRLRGTARPLFHTFTANGSKMKLDDGKRKQFQMNTRHHDNTVFVRNDLKESQEMRDLNINFQIGQNFFVSFDLFFHSIIPRIPKN